MVQSEVTLRPNASRWIVTTTFMADERLGIAVPVQMREFYQRYATEITGTATYDRFRTFNVTTGEGAAQAAPGLGQ